MIKVPRQLPVLQTSCLEKRHGKAIGRYGEGVSLTRPFELRTGNAKLLFACGVLSFGLGLICKWVLVTIITLHRSWAATRLAEPAPPVWSPPVITGTTVPWSESKRLSATNVSSVWVPLVLGVLGLIEFVLIRNTYSRKCCK